jgi:hypothetical protein
MISKKALFLRRDKPGFLLLALLLCLGIPPEASAQRPDKPLLGIELRPIIPGGLVSNLNMHLEQDGRNFDINPQPGISMGAVLRFGISKTFTIESGLSYTQRVYRTSYTFGQTKDKSDFHLVNYELPILEVIYVRLSQNVYLNNAFGLGIDFLPNDLRKENPNYLQLALRKNWVLPGLMAKVGAEYRTQKNGYFYFGGSYHRMLVPLIDMGYYYYVNGTRESLITTLEGHYFAIDFKYFFPNQRSAPLNLD